MNRPLCLHPLALTPWERVCLHADRILAFRPGSAPVDENFNPGYYKKKGQVPNYGRIKAIAQKFIDGGYDGLDMNQVAAKEDCSNDSLRMSVWKLKHKYVEKPRRLQQRRAVA